MYDFTGDFETFYTGETDNTLSGLYDTFRGSPDLPHWEGKHCSNIQTASDGTKFQSFIKENETLLFFRKSMCRPQRLVSNDEEVGCGLNGVTRFELWLLPNKISSGLCNERKESLKIHEMEFHNFDLIIAKFNVTIMTYDPLNALVLIFIFIKLI